MFNLKKKYNLKTNTVNNVKKTVKPVIVHNPLSVHSSNSLIHVLTNLVKIVRDEELASQKKLEKLSKEKLIFDKKIKILENIDLNVKKNHLYKTIFSKQFIFSKNNEKINFRKNKLFRKNSFIYYKNFFSKPNNINNKNLNLKNKISIKYKNCYKDNSNKLLFFVFKGVKKFQNDIIDKNKKIEGINFFKKFRRYVRAKTGRNKSYYYNSYKMFSAYDYAKIKYRNKLIYLLPKNLFFNSLKNKFLLKIKIYY